MKSLIAYFSWSNNTKHLVEAINTKLKADIIRIEREVPYSDDYDTCAYVQAKEEVNQRIHPSIKPITVNVNEYDRILLFFPIWWYTFPMPIGTFIEHITRYKGEVIVFANSYTNDPQYMVNSLNDLKAIDASIDFRKGLLNKDVNEHIKFLERKEI